MSPVAVSIVLARRRCRRIWLDRIGRYGFVVILKRSALVLRFVARRCHQTPLLMVMPDDDVAVYGWIRLGHLRLLLSETLSLVLQIRSHVRCPGCRVYSPPRRRCRRIWLDSLVSDVCLSLSETLSLVLRS